MTIGRPSSCPSQGIASLRKPWNRGRTALPLFRSRGVPTTEGEGRQDEGGEKKYEERYREHLDRYYDEVIGQLGHPEALLILGPGEAKLQRKERLSHFKELSGCPVGIETTDKLTDPQIVAEVRKHYGIAG